ncbi:MAG: C25 family cysteine peptidase [Bacteroidota bacterium]
MKKFNLFMLLLIFLMLGVINSFSQVWIPLNGNINPVKPSCQVIETGDFYIILDVELLGFFSENIIEGSTTYQKLTFPEYATTDDIGFPAMPNISELIQIPEGSNLTITIFNETVTHLNGYTVYPFQTPLEEDQIPTGFDIDNAFYSTDVYYPNNSANLSEIMTFRNVANTNMVLTPIKYNPQQGKLEILSSFSVRIEYDQMFDNIVYNFSRTFDNIHKKAILNYSTPTNISSTKSTDYNLLIIASDQYANGLDQFINWKISKGYKTKLATISDIGSNSVTDIWNYISNEFNTNNIEYVLLVGEDTDIPMIWGQWLHSCYGIPGGYNWYPPGDYGYGCVVGLDADGYPDFQPEVLVGRFSVKNTTELQNMIDKSINYETNPPQNNWLEKCLLIAHQEYAPGNYQQCKEEIRTATYSEMTIEFDIAYGAHAAQGGNDATNQNIINSINAGRGVVNYRGHGSVTGFQFDWSYQNDEFSENELTLLTNGNETPVIFSIACTNNCLYSQTLSPPIYYCLGESFTTSTQRAVAFYGATCGSYTVENHITDKRIFHYAFNDPTIKNIADITTLSTIDMLTSFSYNCSSKKNARIYLWLGDPTLELWTGIPENLIASCSMPYACINQSNNINISISNLASGQEALVSLYQDNIIEYLTVVGDVNNQATAQFVNINPTTIGNFIVTVSSHNYIPFQLTVPVVDCSVGFDLYAKDTDDDNGFEPFSGTGNIWLSPSLINKRNYEDPSTVSMIEEGVLYNAGQNYMYVKVQNRGTVDYLASGGAEIELYWTRARSGEIWFTHWDATDIANQVLGVPQGGLLATVPINQELQLGQEKNFYAAWSPPDPATLTSSTSTFSNGLPMICYLARIIHPADPMVYDSPGIITPHIIENNNVVTRNSWIESLSKFPALPYAGPVFWLTSADEEISTSLVFEPVNEHTGSTFNDWGEISIYLHENLFDNWQKNGAQGTGFRVFPEEKKIVLTSNNARLDSIMLEKGADYPVMVTYTLNKLSNPLENYRYEYRIRSIDKTSNIETVGFYFDVTVKPPEHFLCEITESTFASCAGSCDASATVNGFGGMPPYFFQWGPETGNQTNSTATGLCEGIYSVIVTDALGAMDTATVTINADPALFNYTGETVLTSNTNWNGVNLSINDTIFVPADIILNISYSNIEFGTFGKIWVKKGGKLVVDNSKLSNLASCNNLWGGIVIVGDHHIEQPSSNPLLTGYPQSFAWLKNNSIIENAGTGVYLGDPWYKDTRIGSGSILWMESSSKIRNCNHGVEFKGYLFKNRTHFIDCEFICDASVPNTGAGTRFFIMNWGANGLTFNNVTFSNSGNFSVSERGTAFNSPGALQKSTFNNCIFLNLTTGIKGIISSTQVTNSDFTGMTQGIAVTQYINELGNNVFKANIFDNVLEGIYIQGGYLDDITYNSFSNIHPILKRDGYGVYLVSSGGFHIEKNSFNGQPGTSPKTNASYGVVVENSDKTGGIIFDNAFSGTNFGIQTQDKNDNLAIRCNTFSNLGTYGVYVYDGSLRQQGVNCNPTGPPNRNENQAGNEWLGVCTGTKEMFVNNSVKFDYYAHYMTANNSESTVPDCSSLLWKTYNLKICNVKKTATSCISYLPGLPAPPPITPYADYINAIKSLMSENEQQMETIKNEIPVVSDNTDGGNTTALIASINDLSISGGQLKNILLQSSPLSTEALLALLNRQVPLTPGNLQIVLSANSPLTYEVLNALQVLSLPLGTMNVINAAQQNEPQYPTVEYLEEKLNYLNGENQLLENEIIRQQLQHDEKQFAKATLEQTKLHPSKKAHAEDLIVEEQIAEGRLRVAEILEEGIDVAEDEQYMSLMNTLADLKEADKNIQEIEQIEEDIIRTVANAQKIVSAKAQVALELAKEEYYPHFIKKEMDDKNFNINNSGNESSEPNWSTEVIKVYPNPNNGNMEIEYIIPEDAISVLSIYNIDGKQILSCKLNPKSNHHYLNNEGLFSSGIYHYTLTVNDNVIVRDKLVIIK